MSVYKGTVSQQFFTTSKNGSPQFVMMVDLTDKLKGYQESEGLEPIEPRTIDSRLSFSPGTATDISTEALQHLGFTSDDIGLLAPETPGFFNLVGKKILVRESPNKTNPTKVYWNYYVPRAPKIASATEVRASLGDVYRQQLQAKKTATVPF